jgi:hypothetical protein
MHRQIVRFAALATLAFSAVLPAQAQSFVQVRDWDVYVDVPTRFAYVKTPKGWTFVRQLDEAQMAQLPASTLTSLLPPEPVEIHYAHPAMELSPRMLAMRAAAPRHARAEASVVQQ